MSNFEEDLLKLLNDDRDEDIQKLPNLEDIQSSKNKKGIEDSLESLLGMELEERPIEEELSQLFIREEDLNTTLTEEIMKQEMAKVEEETHMINMESENPNLEEEVVEELILIEGPYHGKVRDFLMNENVLPKGDMPIAFRSKNGIIMIRKINPEPKALFILTKVLTGFKLWYLTEEVEEELDIMRFLGRPNLIKS